jgi:hypothetical protein
MLVDYYNGRIYWEVGTMSEIEITIRLPQELVEEARAAGIEIEDATPDIVALIEKRIERKEAWQNLIDMSRHLEGSLTQEEIEAELAAAKTEHVPSDQI